MCLTAPINAAVCFCVLTFPAVEQVKMIGGEVCINISDRAGIIHAHKPERVHVSVHVYACTLTCITSSAVAELLKNSPLASKFKEDLPLCLNESHFI